MNERQLLLKKQIDALAAETQTQYTLHFDVPLSECSTFKIGGKADCAAYPKSAEELIAVYRAAKECGMSVYVAGNASNILFDDSGYRGTVIFTGGLRSISIKDGIICAGSGVTLSALSSFACKEGRAGLEFLYGIPGTVGGGIYMNCGAFGGEIADVLRSSTYYDPALDKCVTISRGEHGFGYRKSCYIGTDHIILSAEFETKSGRAAAIRESMDEYMNYRTENQPLDLPSAGSVFKRYPGYYTSRLIEEAGLKGRTVGGAQVSLRHAGFIVNLGGATAADVKNLIEIIKEEILQKYGISIECEVIFAPVE